MSNTLDNLPKLNPKIKKRWLKALRSGKYQQGTGALCQSREDGSDKVGFCCLGVLCDVVRNDKAIKAQDLGWTWNPWADVHGNDTDEGGWWQFGDEEGDLPAEVFEYVTGDDPHDTFKSFGALVSRNDGDWESVERHSFKQIAKIIEERC